MGNRLMYGNYVEGYNLVDELGNEEDVYNKQLNYLYYINIFSPTIIERIGKKRILLLPDQYISQIKTELKTLDPEFHKAYLPYYKELENGTIIFAPHFHPYARFVLRGYNKIYRKMEEMLGFPLK